MSDIHTLVITTDRHPLDHEPADVDYAIECPGVTDACREWVGCDVANCAIENGQDGGEVHHGKRHQYIAGNWSVPTDTCYLMSADEMPDAAEFLTVKNRLGPGRYTVGHDFDEGCIADFQLLAEVTA